MEPYKPVRLKANLKGVTIDVEVEEFLRELGDGNLSRGVRLAARSLMGSKDRVRAGALSYGDAAEDG